MKEKKELEVLAELKGKARVYNYKQLKKLHASYHFLKNNPTQKCAFCGNKKTELVGHLVIGDLSGGWDTDEYLCEKCDNYSVYEREWG